MRVVDCGEDFWHSCIGACRHQQFLMDDANLTHKCYPEEKSPLAQPQPPTQRKWNGLQQLLGKQVLPPTCTLSFVGDSIMHDTWAAAIAGARQLGWNISACRFAAGRALWQEAEWSHFCGSNEQIPTRNDTFHGVSHFFSSWAKLTAAPGSTVACQEVSMHYWEYGGAME